MDQRCSWGSALNHDSSRSSDCKDDGITVAAAIVTVDMQSPTQHLAMERSREGRMSHNDNELYRKAYFLAPDSLSGTQLSCWQPVLL